MGGAHDLYSQFILNPINTIAAFFQYTIAFADIPQQQLKNKAIQFIEALKTETPEKIYSSFLTDDLKKEATLEQVQPILIRLKSIVNNAEVKAVKAGDGRLGTSIKL